RQKPLTESCFGRDSPIHGVVACVDKNVAIRQVHFIVLFMGVANANYSHGSSCAFGVASAGYVNAVYSGVSRRPDVALIIAAAFRVGAAPVLAAKNAITCENVCSFGWPSCRTTTSRIPLRLSSSLAWSCRALDGSVIETLPLFLSYLI